MSHSWWLRNKDLPPRQAQTTALPRGAHPASGPRGERRAVPAGTAACAASAPCRHVEIQASRFGSCCGDSESHRERAGAAHGRPLRASPPAANAGGAGGRHAQGRPKPRAVPDVHAGFSRLGAYGDVHRASMSGDRRREDTRARTAGGGTCGRGLSPDGVRWGDCPQTLAYRPGGGWQRGRASLSRSDTPQSSGCPFTRKNGPFPSVACWTEDRWTFFDVFESTVQIFTANQPHSAFLAQMPWLLKASGPDSLLSSSLCPGLTPGDSAGLCGKAGAIDLN